MQTWSLPTVNAPEVFVFSDANSVKDKRSMVKKVNSSGSVLIVSYETLRCENDLIAAVNYFYVILDEG